ncbi:uncharacterized protein CELE_F14D7.18 [Caenorhabditis elegans]|uniref:Uncharacterized protein n=1 Tax=Caenorhabditis elegans TaxID=6239 RepID=G1K0X8_CAEEL|nr:Uncharacterized protein CELE_F14D7.18 [Caenorhabditis elegans]CCC42168.1 Uncharacterized protein CELE_F14D7.18 [Caenorhabditis elegans]|eukprot:NP_001256572.1 Uncharacterized protein CELE_F14D7.18 [Caenorhabditis elegans]
MHAMQDIQYANNMVNFTNQFEFTAPDYDFHRGRFNTIFESTMINWTIGFSEQQSLITN